MQMEVDQWWCRRSSNDNSISSSVVGSLPAGSVWGTLGRAVRAKTRCLVLAHIHMYPGTHPRQLNSRC